ncbi:hypothetical protein MBLNU459_g7848t2 [Dothideomycetes sp. NU459]
MHVSSAIVSLLVAGAAALPGGPSTLRKRTPGSVYLCTGDNWTGQCEYLVNPLNTCVDLGNFTSKVSSFGPDEGSSCLLMQGHCNANENYYGEIEYPGYSNLSTIGWADKASSFFCESESVSKEAIAEKARIAVAQ